MSVDQNTVKRVANLARINIEENRVESLQGELNSMLGFVQQLNELNVENVDPMTSVMPMDMKMRIDEIRDGNKASQIVANAPETVDNFFVVPKVVE